MRRAVPRDVIEQSNDENTFRFFPRRMAHELARDRGRMDELCGD